MSAARIGGMILLFLLSISARVLRWVLKPVARPMVAMLLLFLLSFSSFPVAQSRSDARLRLVSVNQGETIVQAAWELRRGLNPKPDCSHFIQAVYAKAGFVYDYANTREIYTGVDAFRRVQHPQPGDLVVWQGHMGIVIDPGEHSFYSSVLSGFAIENYQSHYWQARVGYPRFYRFVVKDLQQAPRTTRTLRAGATQVHPASNQASLQQTQGVPVSVSSQKPGVMATATVADGSNPPLLRPVSTEKTTAAVARQVSSQKPDLTVARPALGQKAAMTMTATTVADSRIGASRQLPSAAPASSEKAPGAVARPVSGSSQKPALMTPTPTTTTVADSHVNASPQPAQITAEPSARTKVEAEAEAGKTVTPDTAIHGEIFVTSQATPSRREVLAAIIRAADDNGEHLLRGRLLDWQPLVAVVDGFRLVSLDVQGNSGLAEVEVTQLAAFRNGKPSSSRLTSTRRVILSRQQQGWILVTPQELLYLNHQQATKALTDQLAALSKTPADQLQAKKTARILRELLAAKSPGLNAGGSD